MSLVPEKLILDVCCGGRMFWFNKSHPNAVYMDQRTLAAGFVKERPNFKVEPDIVADFREIPFPDEKFKLVVFDPPHLKYPGAKSYMGAKYGKLDKKTWREDLRNGFNECWRVLDLNGVLVFKWNDHDISLHEVLKTFPVRPLIGHTTTQRLSTTWCLFMKIPESEAAF